MTGVSNEAISKVGSAVLTPCSMQHFPSDGIQMITPDLRGTGGSSGITLLAEELPERSPASAIAGREGADRGPELIAFTKVSLDVHRAPVLRDLDWRLAAGNAVGIVGANGAGKTTLLHLAASAYRPASGTALVLGADLAGPPPSEVRRAICLIGHHSALYPQLSLAENLRFIAELHGRPPSMADAALQAVGLARAADRQVGRCSQGMVKRAELARAVISQPTLLLLDEPHAGLDPEARELVDFLISGVRERAGAAVVVSHDRELLAPLVDEVLELRDGRLSPVPGFG